MAERIKVANVYDILPGVMKQVRVLGKAILLANVDGEFFAIGDTCTHKQCSLSTGLLDGTTVICPCHSGQYDVTTGEVLASPPATPEPSYTVIVENAEIFIEI